MYFNHVSSDGSDTIIYHEAQTGKRVFPVELLTNMSPLVVRGFAWFTLYSREFTSVDPLIQILASIASIASFAFEC